MAVLSDDKTSDNLLFVLEPARYESVASHMGKRPATQPEANGFVLGVLRMEVMANAWLKLPEFKIPPSIDIYISANGKALASRTKGSPPLPVRGDAAASTSPPTEPPVGGALVSEEFKVGNANFTVVFVAPARYIADYGTWKPAIASLVGLLITGLVVGYFWLLTDRMAVVERQTAARWHEVREKEHYIRYLIDNTSDAVFLRDQQGKILDINKRACDSLGYSREELLSMTVADMELPIVAENPGPLVKRSAEEYPRTFEGLHRRKDGTTFPVEVHSTLMGIGSQPVILAIVRDITDRKRAEMASS